MTEQDGKALITPATTPGSVKDGECILVPRSFHLPPRSPWYRRCRPPYAILTVSIIQILFHYMSTGYTASVLRYEPNKQTEVWRFLTYMFIHNAENIHHLILNVIIQCMFAVILEIEQGSVRVLLLYICGGVVGALGSACVHPEMLIGASAGVYALLISHISHVLLNYNCAKYRTCRIICVGIIVITDISYHLGHIKKIEEPIISWSAHAAGAITGFLMGLVLYKSTDNCAKTKSKTLFWTGLVMFMFLLISLVIVNIQIRKCTPSDIIRTRYIYLC